MRAGSLRTRSKPLLLEFPQTVKSDIWEWNVLVIVEGAKAMAHAYGWGSRAVEGAVEVGVMRAPQCGGGRLPF